MTQEKLSEAHTSKGLNKIQMAKLIVISQTTYSRKENGKSTITKDEWQRFAKVLEVNVDDIKREKSQLLKNENYTFNENNVGINYVNIPQNLLDIILNYNTKLESDNEKLEKNINIMEKENQNLKLQLSKL